MKDGNTRCCTRVSDLNVNPKVSFKKKKDPSLNRGESHVTAHPKKNLFLPTIGVYIFSLAFFFTISGVVHNKVGRERLKLFFSPVPSLYSCLCVLTGCESRWFKRIRQGTRGMIVRLFRFTRAYRRTTRATGYPRTNGADLWGGLCVPLVSKKEKEKRKNYLAVQTFPGPPITFVT